MGSKTNQIATEAEARNNFGTTGTATAKNCVTYARAKAFGCGVTGTYSVDYKLVKYSDLYKIQTFGDVQKLYFGATPASGGTVSVTIDNSTYTNGDGSCIVNSGKTVKINTTAYTGYTWNKTTLYKYGSTTPVNSSLVGGTFIMPKYDAEVLVTYSKTSSGGTGSTGGDGGDTTITSNNDIYIDVATLNSTNNDYSTFTLGFTDNIHTQYITNKINIDITSYTFHDCIALLNSDPQYCLYFINNTPTLYGDISYFPNDNCLSDNINAAIIDMSISYFFDDGPAGNTTDYKLRLLRLFLYNHDNTAPVTYITPIDSSTIITDGFFEGAPESLEQLDFNGSYMEVLQMPCGPAYSCQKDSDTNKIYTLNKRENSVNQPYDTDTVGVDMFAEPQIIWQDKWPLLYTGTSAPLSKIWKMSCPNLTTINSSEDLTSMGFKSLLTEVPMETSYTFNFNWKPTNSFGYIGTSKITDFDNTYSHPQNERILEAFTHIRNRHQMLVPMTAEQCNALFGMTSCIAFDLGAKTENLNLDLISNAYNAYTYIRYKETGNVIDGFTWTFDAAVTSFEFMYDANAMQTRCLHIIDNNVYLVLPLCFADEFRNSSIKADNNNMFSTFYQGDWNNLLNSEEETDKSGYAYQLFIQSGEMSTSDVDPSGFSDYVENIDTLFSGLDTIVNPVSIANINSCFRIDMGYNWNTCLWHSAWLYPNDELHFG
jgi:hypothetical protein